VFSAENQTLGVSGVGADTLVKEGLGSVRMGLRGWVKEVRFGRGVGREARMLEMSWGSAL
jgi:hypothetical protein